MKNEFRTNTIRFCAVFLVYFFVYKLMLFRHYALDSYGYVRDPLGYNLGNIGVGRVLNYLCTIAVNAVGLNYVENQRIFAVLLMLSFAVSTHLLAIMYSRLAGKRYEYFVLPLLLTFGNVLALEWFFFPEMMLAWAFAVLFMAIAVRFLGEFFSVKNVLLSLLFIVISYCFYQGTVGLYVILSIVAIYYRERGDLNKRSLWQSVVVAFVGFFGGALNLVITRIACNIAGFAVTSRIGEYTVDALIENAKLVRLNWHNWIYTMNGLIPGKMFLAFTVILTVIAFLFSGIRHKWKGMLYFVLMLAASNLSYLTPHFLTMELWMPQRTMVAMFALITMPVFVMLLDIDTGLFEWIGIILCGVMFVVNVIKIDDISVNFIANNRMDEEVARMIQNRIDLYETATGQEVEVVYFHTDYDAKPGYDSVEYKVFDTNRKAFSIQWAAVECLSYFSGRSYESRMLDDLTFNAMFGDSINWNELELDEQLHFDQNVLYMAGY